MYVNYFDSLRARLCIDSGAQLSKSPDLRQDSDVMPGAGQWYDAV